jgi:glutathione synthase/RimK-type ligase-like ATP-grasp enzyme
MIAIHHRENSFSEKWISYCESNKLGYIILNIFDSNIIQETRNNKIKYFLFHFGTENYETDLYLKKLVYVLENEGIKVFPSFSLYWHYDDKLSQKYLFESLGLPHVPMRIFYQKQDAINWLNEATYPFVFKLRCGAGSRNVRLVKNKQEATKLISTMFGKGIYPARSVFADFKSKARKHSKKKDWKRALLRFPKTFFTSLKANQYLPPEKGYFLTQEFYPNNQFDTRITVIGKKAFGFRRFNRPGDFKASGSGLIDYNPDTIDPQIIKTAFEIAEKIDDSSLAFDFIYDLNGYPKILEISYCYVSNAVFDSGGYWNDNLKYFKKAVIPEYEIIDNLLKI